MPDIRLSQEQIRIVEQEMAGLVGKAAKRQAAILSTQFGVSASRIYAHSRSVRPNRKRREDAGEMRTLNQEQFHKLAYYTTRLDLSASLIAEVSGANNLGEIAPSTYNRHLRQKGISRRINKSDVKPYVSWEARWPNQIHQLDSTVAQQYYLDDDGSVGYEPELIHNKNKPGNLKPRLVLLGLIDDHSRVKFARFALGNHAYAWMNFLYHAWRVKDDQIHFPFHGLPTLLYSDNDSVIKSKKFTLAMKALEIKIMTHKVGNPRAKGKVEVCFKLLQEFEKVTQAARWKNFDEANAALHDFLYFVNNRKHSATKVIPFERWSAIPESRLRCAPDADVFRLLHLEELCKKIKKDVSISIDGKIWFLGWKEPWLSRVGEYVTIYRAPNEQEKIFVICAGKEYEVPYHGKRIQLAGQHEELAVPERLLYREQIETQSDPNLKLTMIYKERHARPYEVKTGQKFDDTRITGDKPTDVSRNRLWFILECQNELSFDAPPEPHEQAWIDSVFNGKLDMPESALRKFIDAVKFGETVLSRPALQAVAGT